MRKLFFLLALCLATAAQAYDVTVKAYFHQAPTDKVCTEEHLSAYNIFLLNSDEVGGTSDLKTAAKYIAGNLDDLAASHATTLTYSEYDDDYEQYGVKFKSVQDDGWMFLVVTYGTGDNRYLYVGTRKISVYGEDDESITLTIDDENQYFTKWTLVSEYNKPDDGSIDIEAWLYVTPATADASPATANATNYKYAIIDADEITATNFDAAVEYIGKNITALMGANPVEDSDDPYYYRSWGQYVFQFTCKVKGTGTKYVVITYDNNSAYHVGRFTLHEGEDDPEIDDTYGSIFSDWIPLGGNTPATMEMKATDGVDYYATFSSDQNVKFKDATVYTVSITGTTLQLNEIASKEVPANTGVLVKTHNTTAEYEYVSSAAAVVDNMLRPASEEKTGNYKFYKLAYGDGALTPSTLGFYYGAPDGAAFTSREGSAYLAVPAAAAAKGYSFVTDDATAIKNVEDKAKTSAAYNLAGQRVKKNAKGIIIVNGKKMLNK